MGHFKRRIPGNGLRQSTRAQEYLCFGGQESLYATAITGPVRLLVVVLVFNVPPTAKVIWRCGHGFTSQAGEAGNRICDPPVY